MSENPIITPDSADAASYRTVSGWVSRDGRFYGQGSAAEHLARLAGATHRHCDDCATLIANRHWLVCDSCRTARDIKKHARAPRAAWDGHSLLYSDRLEAFFSAPEEALEQAEINDEPVADLESLRLYLCRPVHAPQLDVDFFEGALPEDSDGLLPDWANEAIAQFNRACANRPALSWEPDKYAFDVAAYNSNCRSA